MVAMVRVVFSSAKAAVQERDSARTRIRAKIFFMMKYPFRLISKAVLQPLYVVRLYAIFGKNATVYTIFNLNIHMIYIYAMI